MFQNERLTVTAVPVNHGPIPAIAWRVDSGDYSVVFSGDMSGKTGHLPVLARDADVLIAHNAIPEGATGVARVLHMPPSVIGEITKSAGVGQVVLSHRMSRTLGREDETQTEIRRHYSGNVQFADDLDCIAVDHRQLPDGSR